MIRIVLAFLMLCTLLCATVLGQQTASEWLDKGNALYDLGEYNYSIQAYDNAIKLDPRLSWAWTKKGLALSFMGRFEDALVCYNQSLGIDSENAETWIDKGKALESSGKAYIKCSFSTSSILSISPRYLYSWQINSSYYPDIGRHEAAVNCYDEALKIDPRFIEALNYKGFQLDALGRYNESIECYNKSLEIDLNDATAWMGKGHALGSLNRFQDSMDCYEHALRIDPNRAEAWNAKGIVLYLFRKYNDSLKCFDKAIEINPSFSFGWNNKGLAFQSLNRYEEALLCFKKALEISPEYAGALINKGNVLSNLERNSDAIFCYARAMNLYPVLEIVDSDIYSNNDYEGRYTESLKGYDGIISVQRKYAGPGHHQVDISNDTMYWLDKGVNFADQGLYEKAINCYDEIISTNQWDAVAWNKKGRDLFKLNRKEEAIRSFNEALKINAYYVEAWYNKADVLESLSRLKEAQDSYEKANQTAALELLNTGLNKIICYSNPMNAIDYYNLALQMDPRCIGAWYDKALALKNLGKWENESNCYSEILKVNPGDVEALTNKGSSLFKLGRLQEAKECYDNATEINWYYAYAWNNKGHILASLGDYRGAIYCFNITTSLKPRYGPAWKNKGNILCYIGSYNDALSSFDEALDIDSKDGSVWCGKGIVLHQLGRYKEAVNCFDEAIKIDPKSVMAWTRKGNSLNLSGNPIEAIECYDRAIAANSQEAGFEGAWTKKGEVFSHLAKYEEAISCYGRAIEISSLDIAALVGKENALRHLNRNSEADECENEQIKCYNMILAINPNSVLAWKEEGDIFLKISRYEKAIECYDNALLRISQNYFDILEYNEADILENKGVALDNLGRKEEASQCHNLAKTIKSMPLKEMPSKFSEGFSIEIETFINESFPPLGQDGSEFYEISNFPEISSSYDFMKRYYELDRQSDPMLERKEGHTYLTTYAGGFFMPIYKPDVFDCSQMAALLEYYLERSGIKAEIACSNSFALGGNSSKHAWTEVDLPGGPYYIDATRHKPEHNKIMLIAPEDGDYAHYSKPDHLYDNIYDLIKDSHNNPNEDNKKYLYIDFNWWDSSIFMKDQQSLGKELII